ncbi:MAG TPA: fumarylacetoacetate hydrolase family protein [Actinomycetospora sp.]|jgi:2-keto-4-pentenoate hydratase|uniref:2-keto-4-pentenoate hydratase n=1 Tax=Actinomycetospora sp. TaxID=1872135 RepID=UPI002F416506
MTAPAIGSREAIRAAAERLADAARTGVPCAPVRDLVGSTDIDAAYAVQKVLRDEAVASGRRIVGRKIGLTAEVVQRQLGVDRPDFGVLYEDMAYTSGQTIPSGRLLQPKVEAEVALELGIDLDGPTDPDGVRAAVRRVLPALEIVDSRIAGWDITFGDTVADNASSGLYVLGENSVATHDLGALDLPGITMTLTKDGEPASSGTGEACLGDPVSALFWLALEAHRLGDPLRAGQIVLSGALGPMVPVEPGATVSADLHGLGSVSCTFSSGEDT